MYDQRRMVRAPLALGLPVALVILALSACSGVGGQEQANKPRHLPEGSYPIALHPGEYRSEEFEPSFSFDVGKGWENNRLETSDKLAISRGGEEDPVLVFRNLKEVYDYDKTGTMQSVVRAPSDMVGWFQHHPYLDTEKPEPATVGGVKGLQFDYIVREDTPSEEITSVGITMGIRVMLGRATSTE